MSKIFELESDYREIKAVNSSGSTLTAGYYFASGNMAGFSLVDVAAGAAFALVVAAPKVKVVKNAGEAWTAGERLYYDESESEITKVASGNIFIGHAAEAATSAAEEGWVDFNGELKSIQDMLAAFSFTDLADTPAAITASQYVKGNTGGDALEFVAS